MSSEQSQNEMMENNKPNVWKERPFALRSQYDAYETMNMKMLFDCYQHDNLCMQEDPSRLGLSLPPLDNESNKVRVCQWNINYLMYATCHYFPGNQNDAAIAVANVLLETQAHVLILNEYGTCKWDCIRHKPLHILHKTLEEAGYTICVANTPYPTAVATRLPLLDDDPAANNQLLATKLYLEPDQTRGAVLMPVIKVCNDNDNNNNNNNHSTILIVGTHLEDSDDENGKYRREGMTQIVEYLQQKLSQKNDADKTPTMDGIILAGDLNQQRQCDYTPSEWQAICANKERRDSPSDDGVADLLQKAGFRCSYDFKDSSLMTNWKTADDINNPPPSTHWTGTIVDYCYGKDCKKSLRPSGIYVSPCGLSDHRLIVTDWQLKS